jgi:hypothetical protein
MLRIELVQQPAELKPRETLASSLVEEARDAAPAGHVSDPPEQFRSSHPSGVLDLQIGEGREALFDAAHVG